MTVNEYTSHPWLQLCICFPISIDCYPSFWGLSIKFHSSNILCKGDNSLYHFYSNKIRHQSLGIKILYLFFNQVIFSSFVLHIRYHIVVYLSFRSEILASEFHYTAFLIVKKYLDEWWLQFYFFCFVLLLSTIREANQILLCALIHGKRVT